MADLLAMLAMMMQLGRRAADDDDDDEARLARDSEIEDDFIQEEDEGA